MYYGDSVRHLLLTPTTKYKFTVQGAFNKCLTKNYYYMYYGVFLRHFFLTPITKYKFTRTGMLYKVLLTSVSRKNH